MPFVLDASIALSWCFADERTSKTQALLEALENEQEEAVSPGIWPLEVSNVLTIAERQKRISYKEMVSYLELLASLSIDIDEETSTKAFHEITLLAYSEKITTYDAAYLELAIRRGFPLATRDKVLAHVAERLGVTVLT